MVPPRAHGELDEDRSVTFLELFYDLVFVVLVAQVAHHLAGDVSWRGVLDFTAVFGLIWIAWLNGTSFHEMHGRNDGRSRSFIFFQMYLLVILAVLTSSATDPESSDGRWFINVFAVLLLLDATQWWSLRRVDQVAADRRVVTNYVYGLIGIVAVLVASSFVEAEYRPIIWVIAVALWVMYCFSEFGRTGRMVGYATDSMVERFGLFNILVLGEVVVGVVNGLIEAERTPISLITGLLCLTIGFGFWWNYFDLAGRRPARVDSWPIRTWTFIHLPLSGAIAATGAGMISLIEHAADPRTPAATAWLISGASASILVWTAVVISTINFDEVLAKLVRPIIVLYLIGAAASLLAGFFRPQAWLLALCLGVIHGLIWQIVFIWRAKSGAPLGQDSH